MTLGDQGVAEALQITKDKRKKKSTKRIDNLYTKDSTSKDNGNVRKPLTPAKLDELKHVQLSQKLTPKNDGKILVKTRGTVKGSSYKTETFHTIQTGSFNNVADAQKQFDSIVQGLNEKKLEYLRIEKIGKFYAVRLGKFEDYVTADKFLKTIKPKLSTAIILEAYIKNNRIMKLYKKSISSDRQEIYNF